MSRSRVFEDMDMDKDMDMDMDIRMGKLNKVDRPTPPPTRRQWVMDILRVLIHSEPKLARQHQVATTPCIPVRTLVDPSRPQGSRGCLTWTKKEGIIVPVRGRRTMWEVSEVGRGRSMEERKKGRVWLEVRLIRLGRRSWRVSGYGRCFVGRFCPRPSINRTDTFLTVCPVLYSSCTQPQARSHLLVLSTFDRLADRQLGTGTAQVVRKAPGDRAREISYRTADRE